MFYCQPFMFLKYNSSCMMASVHAINQIKKSVEGRLFSTKSSVICAKMKITWLNTSS